MKNIYEVIRQKEAEMQQLQRDIEVLRAAARILADDSERPAEAPASKTATGSHPAVVLPPVNRTGSLAVPAAAGDGSYSAARDNTVRQFP